MRIRSKKLQRRIHWPGCPYSEGDNCEDSLPGLACLSGVATDALVETEVVAAVTKEAVTVTEVVVEDAVVARETVSGES